MNGADRYPAAWKRLGIIGGSSCAIAFASAGDFRGKLRVKWFWLIARSPFATCSFVLSSYCEFGWGASVVLVALAAAAAALAATRTWLRRAALATPVLMVVGMLAVTPAALAQKLDVQYDTTPQCVSAEARGTGPAARAERASQRALESIDHVGYFGGGGGAGVDGCDRSFVLLEDVDVLPHYRSALREAGWRVVEDLPPRLRAERGGMAFEVVRCGRGGVVWAGRLGRGGTIGCDLQ